MPHSKSNVPTTAPVEDTVGKVNDELAVGTDLDFQKRWSKLERVIWILFSVLIILDLLGCFGRGPLANAEMHTPDGTMTVRYERVERFSTPSILTVEVAPQAIHDGRVKLWVSDSLVKPLGNQRIVPQPAESVIGEGGITYTFLATAGTVSVEFALEPSSPGIYGLGLRVPGANQLNTEILVMP